MTGLGSAALRRRAAALGVASSYRDSRGHQVEVGDNTLAAVLGALGADAAGGAGSQGKDGQLARWPRQGLPGHDLRGPQPARRSWGFTVQLYAVRSRRSWGHGDLADLARLAEWSGTELGAGFVLINPLHAAEPAPPVSASPYLPMSRQFISPLYISVEDVPEYADLPPVERRAIEELASPLRALNTSAALIDRDRIWHAKRLALETLHAQPPATARRASFERFRVAGGQPLADWATWCALAEVHGPDWRAWPGPLRDVRSAAVAEARRELAGQVRFHTWLQWVADSQCAAAQAAARAAGMSIGVVTDLAVGSHPGGADAWSQADITVPGMSVGAPPDEFNPRGQDWAQVPWHPARLAASGCRPLAELARAGFRHAGGLRADHVMSFFRLWWVPAGMPASQGTYVRYPHEATTSVLIGEAGRAGALAIGEDLGTVEPWVRDYLASRGVLGTSMLWFERDRNGAPLPAARWRRQCLATVGTHDVPPIAAFVTGEQVDLRARLGLLTGPVEEERARASAALAAWSDALAAAGLLRAETGSHRGGPLAAEGLPGGDTGLCPAEFTVAAYSYLARTPAALVGVSLADAVGDHRPQNMPGTTSEYPNWRVPLCDADGQPVLLEDLGAQPGVTAVSRAVAPAVEARR